MAAIGSVGNVMKNLLVATFVALVVLAAPPAHGQCDLLPGCVLVWQDEFDGTSVDLSKWEFQVGDGSLYGNPGWGNNELQWYQSANTSVANGMLTIQARRQSVGGYAYTSSRLRSLGRGDFKYGRFAMRARLPLGKGLWPAFWMLPSDASIYGVWAASGEIDIMESIGSEQIYGTIHYGGTYPANVSSGSLTSMLPGTVSDFHDYAVEWEPNEIRWYVDGQRFGTKTSWFSTGGPFPAPFDVDFHLLLNLAVGGNFPGNPDGSTVFPQSYVIDYVRVYQQPPPDPASAVQCEASKTKAAGKYAKCASAVTAKAIRGTAAADAARLARCAHKLESIFAKAEQKAAGSCADDGDAASVQAALDACIGDAVGELGGVPGPGGLPARCQSSKVVESGKYLDCRFRTTSLAARQDAMPDFARCEDKLLLKWDRLEGEVSRPCSTNGDLPSVQGDLDACHVEIALALARSLCGNGVVDGDEACDDGNTVSGDGCSDLCALQAEYQQGFEALVQSSGAALAVDGWFVFGNVFDGASGNYLYGYGPYAAPNGGQAFSSLVVDQGGAAQGAHQLSVYSDYNNNDHANGHRIEANVFRERSIVAADVGKTLELSFDAKRGNLGGSSTALAFLKTLNPNAGYSTTNFVAQDTTAIPATWARYSISLDIDASLEGQLLQFGFANRATNYDGSGILYDNVVVLTTPTTP